MADGPSLNMPLISFCWQQKSAKLHYLDVADLAFEYRHNVPWRLDLIAPIGFAWTGKLP